MDKAALLTGLTLGLLAGSARAQTPPADERPQGRFRQSVVRVGEPLDYELRYEHAPDQEVVFPDSLARFAPFEYVGKTWYPTRTRRGRSLDQVVYHLRTFSLDPVQRLALPVSVLTGADTLTLLPAPAQVQLRRQSQPHGPAGGPPALLQNTVLVDIPPAFNYPYWVAGAGGLLLLGAGSATLFRRRLRRRYAAYKRRKNHQYFLAQFARHVERFTLSQSAANVERAVALWKNYLSSLENSALTSFTTREIVAYFEEDPAVHEALAITDRVVYGNLQIEDEAVVARAFGQLREFAEQRYAARVAA